MNRVDIRSRVLRPGRLEVEGAVLSMLALVGLEETDAGRHLSDLVVGCAFTLGIYWLSHVYADVLSRDVEPDATHSVAHLARDAAVTEARIFTPAIGFVSAVIVLRLVGFSIDDALDATLVIGCATLFLWGMVAARRMGSSHVVGAAFGVVGALIGLAVIAGKLLLQH
jgi:hypothetical protein